MVETEPEPDTGYELLAVELVALVVVADKQLVLEAEHTAVELLEGVFELGFVAAAEHVEIDLVQHLNNAEIVEKTEDTVAKLVAAGCFYKSSVAGTNLVPDLDFDLVL